MGTYSSNARGDAARIASECIECGQSAGWSGSLEQLAERQGLLRPFGIVYVDDLSGTWEHRGPKPPGRTVTEILGRVMAAMQPAEESTGPSGEEYLSLMKAIADEAVRRLHNAGKAYSRHA